MYVADVTSMKELEYLLTEAQDELLHNPNCEQAAWDIEDIEARMEELRLEGGGK